MFNILICDDELSTCTYIEQILFNYSKRNKIDITTEIFLTGEVLLNYMKESRNIDLIFLDIELPDKSGAEIGRVLREKLENEIVQIVFISSKEKYAMQLFQVRPFDFLIKPIKKEMIETVFEKYRKVYGKKKRFFEYKIGKTTQKISLKEIMYFMCEGKKICIVTTNDRISYYGKIKEIHNNLEAEEFWSVHVSFIINVHYVKLFKEREIVMCDDFVIPISKTYKKEINQKIMLLNEVK